MDQKQFENLLAPITEQEITARGGIRPSMVQEVDIANTVEWPTWHDVEMQRHQNSQHSGQAVIDDIRRTRQAILNRHVQQHFEEAIANDLATQFRQWHEDIEPDVGVAYGISEYPAHP